jgi:hypothetical protein
MKTIKDLKAMIAQPASKEWFAKHGSPKHKALSKITGRSSKAQLHHESIGELRKMADKEHAGHAEHDKKYGNFEQRFKKFSKFKSNLK